MKPGKILLFAISAAAGIFAQAADLVRDGMAQCPVVIRQDAPPPVRFGAQELVKYLKKITGADLRIIGGKDQKSGNVFIGTLTDAELVKQANLSPSSLREDGFAVVSVGPDVYVIGQNPRGALYGCYHLLKKYGGIRWLVPGEDEEYYQKKTAVTVPEGTEIQNPYLKILKTVADELTAYRWLARNNMLGQARVGQFVNRKTGKRTPDADRMDELAVTGAAYGGHVMTYLMADCSWKKEPLQALFERHPEY
ncbi:MAG: hypothetical protein J6Y48_14190, partial [Clostridia bacterium]|nr:hypothetical protein [Clostridia bacterium]